MRGGGKPAEHEKRALWGAFFVFGYQGRVGVSRGDGGMAREGREGVSMSVDCFNRKKKEPFVGMGRRRIHTLVLASPPPSRRGVPGLMFVPRVVTGALIVVGWWW